MADDDLAQIRAARLQQLKQQQGGVGGGGSSGERGLSGAGNDEQERQRQQEADARSSMLTQILEPEAADRLGRIRMVKESRATDVENRLIMLARSGQLRSKVTETQLKDMLASLTEHENQQSGGGTGNMKVIRRGGGWDDDDLDDLLQDS